MTMEELNTELSQRGQAKMKSRKGAIQKLAKLEEDDKEGGGDGSAAVIG